VTDWTSSSAVGVSPDAKTARTSAALASSSAAGSARADNSCDDSPMTRPAFNRLSPVARSAVLPWAANAARDEAKASLVALPIT
jgi:hypothetical protein